MIQSSVQCSELEASSEQEVGGVKRIECMMLEGDETLFRPELFSGGDVWSVF